MERYRFFPMGCLYTRLLHLNNAEVTTPDLPRLLMRVHFAHEIVCVFHDK